MGRKRADTKAKQAEQPALAEPQVIADLGNQLQVVMCPIDLLREQDMNAQAMPTPMFDQLTQNIQRRGAVESLPYCAKTDRGIEIISGHHRVRAARAAGLKAIPILLDVSGLSRQEIAAKQLAHNSIAGSSDPTLVRKIYSLISDVVLRQEAYIDEKSLAMPELPDLDVSPLENEIRMEHVAFFFLPHQIEKFGVVIDVLGGDETLVGVALIEQWEKFQTAVKAVSDHCEIKAVGMVLSKMCDIVLERIAQEKEERPANGVPAPG